MVEPRDTAHAMLAAADRDATARLQLRQAVVVARELRLRTLLTEAFLPFSSGGCVPTHSQLATRTHSSPPPRGSARHPCAATSRRSCTSSEPSAARRGRTGTRRLLTAQQRAAPLIADRCVREQHLPRDETRRIVFVDARPIAEERDLKAERLAALFQPAGEIPPLGAELRDGCLRRAAARSSSPARPRETRHRQRIGAALTTSSSASNALRDCSSPILLHGLDDIAAHRLPPADDGDARCSGDQQQRSAKSAASRARQDPCSSGRTVDSRRRSGSSPRHRP